MAYSFQHNIEQPKALRWVTLGTLLIGLFSALTLKVPLLFTGVNLQSVLSLSSWGISHGFIWQYITHLFVQPIGPGVSFSFLIHLFFTTYFLWVIGKSIIEYKSSKHFLILFFAGGILSSVICSLALMSFGTPFYINGTSAALFSLLTAWIFLFPDKEVLFFLIIPIRVKWLLLIIAGSMLFIDLANGNMQNFLSYATGVLFGYFYGLLVFETNSPYRYLQKFEDKIINLKKKFSTNNDEIIINPKVYDFRTGKAVVTDEDFMNHCLDKIAAHGRKSLSIKERIKLYWISRKLRNRSL